MRTPEKAPTGGMASTSAALDPSALADSRPTTSAVIFTPRSPAAAAMPLTSPKPSDIVALGTTLPGQESSAVAGPVNSDEVATTTPPPVFKEGEDQKPQSEASNPVLALGTTLLIDGFHGCWAHALLDQFIFLFAAVHKLQGESFTFWFRREHFDIWPANRQMVNETSAKYRGAFHDLLMLLEPSAILFEHLHQPGRRVTMQRMIRVHSNVTLSLWDDDVVFPGRQRNAVRVSRAVRLEPYVALIDYVLERFNYTRSPRQAARTATIIDRKRKWCGYRANCRRLRHIT